MKTPRAHIVRPIALAASVVLVLLSTLLPQGTGAANTSDPFCFPCGDRGLADFIANIILFVPLGIALRAYSGSTAKVLVFGAMMSMLVEAIQWSGAVAGRSITLADIVANSGGALLGAVIAANSRAILVPSRRTARMLLAAHLVSCSLLLLAGKWLLQRPDSPGVVAPSTLSHATGYGWFERDVVLGTIDGVELRNSDGGPLRVASPMRQLHEVSVQVHGRDRREWFVPVLFLHAPPDSTGHLMLAQRGSEYAMRVRVRADLYGFRMPDLVVPDPAGVADTIGTVPRMRLLHGRVSPASWSLLIATDSMQVESAAFRVSTLHAWMLIVPLDRLNGIIAFIGSSAYLMLLLLPATYWALVAFRKDPS